MNEVGVDVALTGLSTIAVTTVRFLEADDVS